MAHDSNRIYAPIDLVSDIYGFFGMSASNTNGNYDVAAGIEFACPRYVNKWARNKPEAIGGPGDLTDAQRKANNFGLTAPATYTTIANYVSAINSGISFGWGYNYPRQANGNWFRMTDLNNYRADAQSPFPILTQSDLILSASSSGTKVLNIALAAGFEGTPESTDYIRLADLNASGACYSDWYVGVLLKKNASIYYIATSDATIKQSISVQFNGSATPGEGSYTGYVFIANKPFKVSSAGSTAVANLQIVPITTSPVNVSVISSSNTLVVSLSQRVLSLQQYTSMVVNVTNKNASQAVVTPVKFELSNSSTGSSYTTASIIGSLSAITAPAGSSANPSVVSKSFSVSVGSYSFARLVYKYSIGSGTTSVNQVTPWFALLKTAPPDL